MVMDDIIGSGMALLCHHVLIALIKANIKNTA